MRRSKIEQVLDILSAVRDAKRPTRIMYAVNLDYRTMKRLLKKLEEQRLIESICKKHRKSCSYTYCMTERGLEALRLWHQLKVLLGGVM